MCGIAAIFAYGSGSSDVEPGELLAIRDKMAARGPDGAGLWISPDRRVGLAHRRLSILDLSEAGAQPMWVAGRKHGRQRADCADFGVGITFNGEIYNYRQLRSALQTLGYHFRSNCDTEVLLHLYVEKGVDMVHDLRGMYAFAIWDAQNRCLFLARDPFGIKPLYYSDDGRTIRVASQVKALLESRQIDTSPEPAGHVGFFLWGHVPDPFTLYRGIRALAAGNCLWISDGSSSGPLPGISHLRNREVQQFCSVPQIFRDAEAAARESASGLGTPRSERERREFLRAAVTDTVEHHLIADVPIGIFLSSGIDSCTLAALASDKHRDLRTVTLGFEEFRGTAQDEVPLAKEIARLARTQHQTVWISRADFEAESDRLLAAMDQPSTDGVNTYFVSLAARRAGLKVAISGLGGDEIFGGYPSFRQIPRTVELLRSIPFGTTIGRGLRIASAGLLAFFTSPKYASLLEYGGSYEGAYLLRRGMFMSWEMAALIEPEFARKGWSDLQSMRNLSETFEGLRSGNARVSALELCWYMRNQLLRDSDWAGMANSLEIRVPFVDVELLRSLAPTLTGDRPFTKQDLAQTPSSSLPSPLLRRPKSGFSVPVRDWLLDADSKAKTDPIAKRGLRRWSKFVHSRFLA